MSKGARDGWSENRWKAHIAKELEAIGATVLRKRGNAGEGKAWPDLYVCHPHFHGWLELKKKNAQPSPAQAAKMRALLLGGADVACIHVGCGNEVVVGIAVGISLPGECTWASWRWLSTKALVCSHPDPVLVLNAYCSIGVEELKLLANLSSEACSALKLETSLAGVDPRVYRQELRAIRSGIYSAFVRPHPPEAPPPCDPLG